MTLYTQYLESDGRWVICDSTGHVIFDVCPCCERPMLSKQSADLVIEEYERDHPDGNGKQAG